jgi:hypothetical protein
MALGSQTWCEVQLLGRTYSLSRGTNNDALREAGLYHAAAHEDERSSLRFAFEEGVRNTSGSHWDTFSRMAEYDNHCDWALIYNQ